MALNIASELDELRQKQVQQLDEVIETSCPLRLQSKQWCGNKTMQPDPENKVEPQSKR